MITGLDHVQLAMPRGQEELARSFYAGLLGMTELPKPPVLAARGGCWFASGSAVLHLGVEDPFAPAKKAHPAIRLADQPSFEALVARLGEKGVPIKRDREMEAEGTARFFAFDPWGNRLEFVVSLPV